MPGATLTTMQAALKRLYLPRLRATVNTRTVLRMRIKKVMDQVSVSGRSAIVPINIRPSEAIGARTDGAALPTPQNQTFVESSVSYSYNYGTIRITHPTIVASRDNQGAWTKALSAEMKGMERDLSNDLNRQDFGYGNGALGQISSVSGGDTLTMKTGHKIKVNMVIDIYNDAVGTTLRQNAATVTAVSGNTVTVSAYGTAAPNDYVFRDDALNAECMGLLGIVDTTTYVTTLQGISRSTYPEWRAQVFTNPAGAGTARQISEALLDDTLLQIEELGEGNVSLGITSRIQFRKIGNLLTPDRRYAYNTTLQGGFKAVEWAGVPVAWDRDCPVDTNGNDHLFWLDESELARYMLAEMDWDDEDGNILARNAGYATYDATLFEYGNLGTTAADNHGVIRDLART